MSRFQDITDLYEKVKPFGYKHTIAILDILANTERNIGVTELSNTIGIGQSNGTQILKRLKEAGFVRDIKENNFVYYKTTSKLMRYNDILSYANTRLKST